MAPTPKHKHSKARKGKRLASRSVSLPGGVTCPNCGKMKLSHRICIHCNQ